MRKYRIVFDLMFVEGGKHCEIEFLAKNDEQAKILANEKITLKIAQINIEIENKFFHFGLSGQPVLKRIIRSEKSIAITLND